MTFAEYAEQVRWRTESNSTTFTDTDLLRLTNMYKNSMAKDIAAVSEDYFGSEELRDLVADQRQYSFPDDFLNQIKALEITLDGTNWRRASEFDLNSRKGNTSNWLSWEGEGWDTTDEDSIRANSSDDSPMYRIFDNSFWIYTASAIPAITDGLKLWVISYPAEFTDLTLTTDMSIALTTTSSGFPRQFHELLARRVSMAYKNKTGMELQQDEREDKFYKDYDDAISVIKGTNMDRVVQSTRPRETGFNL